jgi:hypothetical protein
MNSSVACTSTLSMRFVGNVQGSLVAHEEEVTVPLTGDDEVVGCTTSECWLAGALEGTVVPLAKDEGALHSEFVTSAPVARDSVICGPLGGANGSDCRDGAESDMSPTFELLAPAAVALDDAETVEAVLSEGSEAVDVSAADTLALEATGLEVGVELIELEGGDEEEEVDEADEA